jgi:hypothetical protein
MSAKVRKAVLHAVRLPIIILIQLFSAPDMDMAMDKVVPETLNWKHLDEGPE